MIYMPVICELRHHLVRLIIIADGYLADYARLKYAQEIVYLSLPTCKLFYRQFVKLL